MKARELAELGVPRGQLMRLAQELTGEATRGGLSLEEIRTLISAVSADPETHLANAHFGRLAQAITEIKDARLQFVPRAKPAEWKQWGTDLEAGAVQQMQNACALPVAVRGALMPDAHQGYGLPIGGVLATRNAVIPYAVGVDIACRMKLTVLDMPVSTLMDQPDRLTKAIHDETRFGVGAMFRNRRNHAVMDSDWAVTPTTRSLKDKAWGQLGTSGSGNHFVEFGELTFANDDLGLSAGTYLALLSHSGSRGAGAGVAGHYSQVARSLHPELPRELMHLAWLDLATEAGQKYWHAMELMGQYAAANHDLIHRHIGRNLGVEVMLDVENHHNFAWREMHGGEELIVHRKGATPAGEGVLGLIPGSMGAPGFLVRGLGESSSLNSASHGAGRRMSRTAANAQFNWKDVQRFLKERNVTLISAGLDEAPGAYKDIEAVMAAQGDLVEPIARFEPRLVKMAPAGERPED